MRLDYVIKRFLVLVVVVWVAATLNFFLPRLSTTNPVQQRLMQQAATGGHLQAGLMEMVQEYNTRFGLDKPLFDQYLSYLSDLTRLEFNYSIASYPRKVTDMIGEALPWTIALLGLTTLFAFALGTFLGALLAWPRAPKFIVNFLLPPLLTLSAIPYFLLGLILLYLFAFQIKAFPIFGGFTPGILPDWGKPEFLLDVVHHAALPALSIILAGIGFWALGMRAMMVTTQGEDYMTFAEAKGLSQRTLFFRYAVRNALLPQTTSLALSLGQILSGAILVEVVFSYPGIGTILYHAIRDSDYFLIQGIVLGIIASIGLATFILDLIYPLLDPRITYRRA